ncbi:MAG: glutathione S-transferase N-terminal domain-containing protein [Spirulinaceae cyanobacterium]
MKIIDYEHIGIRVSDRFEALKFYEKIGFTEERYFPKDQASELVTADGVYLNLIFNGAKRHRNILMDEPIKYPGVTHPAFIVDDLDQLLKKLEQENIPVTEGPIYLGKRRRVCFIRDPDGNVLEFDQIYPSIAKQDTQKVSIMKLHDLELSGNCYKIRLFLSLLDIKYELVSVDFMAGQHKSSEFLQLNPLGQIPVLEDDDLILRDSQAILVYLAKKYGGEAWFPSDSAGMAQVTQWLSIATNEIARSCNDARLNQKFGFAVDLEAAQQKAESILNIIEQHLKQRQWLALDRPTIADIACFPYIALSPEGGIFLDKYLAINQWCDRIKKLPLFMGMPGITM